ncbi:MAG: hypothetical protein ACREK4_22740 [Candidatus Rokuibacteriota bacterium]
MLKDEIRQGVTIRGLKDMLNLQTPPFEGYWTLENDTITFSKDPGGTKIKILPYKQRENSSVPMSGLEVISGEFTGCIMGIYKKDGVVHVNHVDTAEDSFGSRPQKEEWETMKKGAGFQLFKEHTTKGEVPGYIFGTLSAEQRKEHGTSIVMLCVASPAGSSATNSYSIARAVVRKDGKDYKVLHKPA